MPDLGSNKQLKEVITVVIKGLYAKGTITESI